ncbi:hypothetical protein O23A_p4442 [Aeromonas salmonicida]|nr:hypothetical protein O23A_p4442 [Aeromonas salmonicida]
MMQPQTRAYPITQKRSGAKAPIAPLLHLCVEQEVEMVEVISLGREIATRALKRYDGTAIDALMPFR